MKFRRITAVARRLTVRAAPRPSEGTKSHDASWGDDPGLPEGPNQALVTSVVTLEAPERTLKLGRINNVVELESSFWHLLRSRSCFSVWAFGFRGGVSPPPMFGVLLSLRVDGVRDRSWVWPRKGLVGRAMCSVNELRWMRVVVPSKDNYPHP